MSIDWTDPTCMVSKHFSVKECLWCNQWGRMATADDGLDEDVQNNLIVMCQKLDVVRDVFGASINIHCFFRPELYNQLVHGAPGSAHKFGKAADFDISGKSCDEVKQYILDNNLLETWNLRMEDNGKGALWVHLGNDYQSGHNRFFIP